MSTRKMYVFDFDDTLVRSPSRVIVIKPNGQVLKLDSAQYASYVPRKGDKLDFSEFEKLPRPKIIREMMQMMIDVYRDHGPSNVAVLTARASALPIRRLLDKLGLFGIEIVTTGTSDPLAKAANIVKWIRERDLHSIEFFDDSKRNIEAVESLVHKFPDVRIKAHLVVHKDQRRYQDHSETSES